MLVTIVALSLLASLCLHVAVGTSLPTRLGAKHLARGPGFENVQLPRAVQCAICPGDIETNDGAANIVLAQETNDGITMCT